MANRIDTLPNRPAGKPVFDYQVPAGFARVALSPVSNDGLELVMTGWAFLVDADGMPVVDPSTGAPIATTDSTRTAHLSGVLAGTHTLYDGWCRYVPPSQTTINADNLPDGWATGRGAPAGDAAIGACYYDLDSGIPYVFQRGLLDQIGTSIADSLQGQIDTAAKLAALGF